ncbi:hypothetical protein D3C71_1921280 [compost metagenome]
MIHNRFGVGPVGFNIEIITELLSQFRFIFRFVAVLKRTYLRHHTHIDGDFFVWCIQSTNDKTKLLNVFVVQFLDHAIEDKLFCTDFAHRRVSDHDGADIDIGGFVFFCTAR